MVRQATLAVILSWALVGAAYAGPEALRFQGVITGLAGFSVDDGSYQFDVKVYDAAVGGTTVFSKASPVTADVTAGAYTLSITPDATGDLKDAFRQWPRFLEITVVSGPQGTINETLLPRQEITSVPFVLEDGVPQYGIILWIESSQCPDGYQELTEFSGLLIRGADTAGADPNVPDAPGESCSGGTGCGAPTEAYDDVLDLSEMPSHSHPIPDELISPDSGPRIRTDSSGLNYERLTHTTDPTGGGQTHYHPFRTVLFCQKQ